MRPKTPFSLSPDPEYLYLTPALEATLHKCRYTIDYQQGLSSILGDAGVGKTSIMRALHNEYAQREDCQTVFMPSPSFATDFAFVKSISLEFGLKPRRSMVDQLAELRAFLIELHLTDKNAILLIDEAQKLAGPILEQVRMLLNFETDDAKMIQIILAGQLELRERLRDPSKKALRSRIFAPSLLAPPTIEETVEMLEYRCERFGEPNPVSVDAGRRAYERARGLPRDVLRICGHAYGVMKAFGLSEISVDAIDASADEIEESLGNE